MIISYVKKNILYFMLYLFYKLYAINFMYNRLYYMFNDLSQ